MIAATYAAQLIGCAGLLCALGMFVHQSTRDPREGDQ